MARPQPGLLIQVAPGTRPALIVLVALGVASGVAALAVALGMAWLVTAVAAGSAIGAPTSLVVTAVAVRGLLAATAEYVAHRTGLACAAAVRSTVLRRWLRVPVEARPDRQEATVLAGEGVAALQPYVARYLPALVTAAVVPALALVILAVVDIWSALIVLLTLPLLPLFAALIGMHTRDQTRTRMQAMTQLAGHFMDVVKGLPTLVAYGRAEHQTAVVREVGDRHRRATVRTLRTAFLSTAALELLATISVAMVAVAVGLRLAYGTIDLQVGLTAILLAPEAYWPIRRVGTEFHNAADGAEVLEELTATMRTPEGGPLQESAPDLGLQGVSYAYPGRGDVLHDVTRHVPASPGLTVVTGPSGCGKSTLLELLAGLRTPHTGAVVCPPAHLAGQRPLLISGTVWDNLALTPGAARDAAPAVLKSVGLWDVVQPRGGLDGVIGDDGFGLSAGQRARLALARAILSDAPVVLLDEPTAHIAADSAPQIREAITDLASHRPVVVATHDPALVAMANREWELSDVPNAQQEDAALAVAQPDHEAAVATDRGETSTEPAEPGWWAAIGPRSRLRLACALGGASVASGVALTATSGWLIVQASFQPVVLTLLVAIVGVRAFGLARPLLRYAERVVSHDVALGDLAQRRADLFAGLIPLTPARLGTGSRADFLTALVRDLDDVVDEQVRVKVPWAATLIASAVAIAVLAFALPWAALVVAGGAVAALAAGEATSRREQPRHDAAVRARGAVLGAATTLADRVSAIQAVSGLRRTHPQADASHEAPILVEVAEREAAFADAEARLIRVRAVGIAATWAVVAVVTAAVASLAAAALADGALSAPWAALVTLTPMALAESWTALPEVGGAKARARSAQTRIDQVLDQQPAIAAQSSTSLGDRSTPVDVVGISARWAPAPHSVHPSQGHLDLDTLTLPTLHTGDRLQVTGPNGAGKSTALAVLARQLDPVAGSYRLAGHDTLDVSVASVRARIAVVDDEPHAFAGTVRANLALAAPGSGDEHLQRALFAVDLGAWLSELPQGLDSRVAGLSGGERARLSMARAVLSRRPIVLMDEPTAHLDDATAKRAVGGVCRSRAADGTAGDQPGVVVPIVIAVNHRPQDWSDFQTVHLEAPSPDTLAPSRCTGYDQPRPVRPLTV